MSARHLARDSRGVAAVEFALLLPILLLLYFGVVELTQGVMTQQRANHVAATVGDLVSQSSSLASADVADKIAKRLASDYKAARKALTN